jgi:5-methylcytosine-specific restriction endonuclease McrA
MWYTEVTNKESPALLQTAGGWPTLYRRTDMPSVPRPPAVADSRTCTKCGETKPVTAFYIKDRRTGELRSRCNDCHNAAKRSRYVPAAPHPRPTERTCTGCGHRLPIAFFHVKNVRTGERRYQCKECRNAANQAYKEAHRDDIRAKSRASYAADPSAAKERIRRTVGANPEKYRAIHSQWKAANKDAVNASTHRRRARIKGNGGSYTAAEWRALKAAHDFRCLMCKRQEPAIRLTVDHVIPISEGGPNTIDNIQPLCKSCNSKKYRRALDLRAQEKG